LVTKVRFTKEFCKNSCKTIVTIKIAQKNLNSQGPKLLQYI
jgi:hypothetical protein